MRLIDADELKEHVWRDRLDSRERIAEMVDRAPTIYSMTVDALYILEHCVTGACMRCSKSGHCEKEENVDAALGMAIKGVKELQRKGRMI